MIFVLPWIVACSTPHPTLVPSEWDTGGDVYWASDWETAACPSWAPYDRGPGTWTYVGDAQHGTVTLSAQGLVTYRDRQVLVVSEYFSDSDWGSTQVYWACEADGLHLAGVSDTTFDYHYSGFDTLFDPPILLGGPVLAAGSTDATYLEHVLRWDYGGGEASHQRHSGTVVIAPAGVVETGVGSLPAWTITLPRGAGDGPLGVSGRAWADGFGAVTIDRKVLDSYVTGDP